MPWIAESYGLELADGYATGCRKESGLIEDANKKDCLASNGNKCSFIENCFYKTDPDGNSSTSIAVTTDNSAGFPLDQCFLGAQAYYAVQMTYLCLAIDGSSIFGECCRHNMDNALCTEFASRNATLCEELAMAVNPDSFAQQLLSFCEAFLNKNTLAPASKCANNCRGVELTDIIAGGSAVLAATSITATSLFIPPVTFALGAAIVGSGGVLAAQQLCMGPLFCRSSQGTCCLLVGTPQGGLRCPSSC